MPRHRGLRLLLTAVVLVGAVLVPATVSQAANVCAATSPGGNPAITRNTDGRLELFLVRADGTYVADLLTGASQRITPSRAAVLTEGANGVLFGSFPGFGTFRYDVATGAFTPVSAFAARALSATPNNELFGSWDGFGTFEYVNGVFSRVSPFAADRLAAVRHGFVYGAWPGFGTFQFTDGVFLDWQELRPIIHAASEGKALLCMSSCFGFRGCKMAMSKDDVPFLALVGHGG